MERSRLRREDNVTMDLKEIGINERNWVVSAQDREYWKALENATLNLTVPKGMVLVNWYLRNYSCSAVLDKGWKTFVLNILYYVNFKSGSRWPIFRCETLVYVYQMLHSRF